LRYVKDNGSKTVGVVNVPTSSVARLTDVTAPTFAGPEIGVASTKAFTCQLAVLAALAISLGRAQGTLDAAAEAALVRELVATVGLIAEALKLEPAVETLAHAIAGARNALYLGRGAAYPLALEGALKLKELSYIHAGGLRRRGIEAWANRAHHEADAGRRHRRPDNVLGRRSPTA
jgi:glucosamine--fructose-6-phosphate aminotransferase (isomerizing)